MKFSSTLITIVKRCLYLLFQNQCPHFLLPPPFWKLYCENYLRPQVSINKMLNKHIVDYHPSLSQLTSRIHPLIFWIFPKPVDSIAIFYHHFPGRRKLLISHFLSEDLFFPQPKGGLWVGWRGYGVETITKINHMKILVTSFDKFHHLCNLYIFGFCFAVALRGRTFCSLRVTFYSLLVTFYSLLVTTYSLLVTRYSLLFTCYVLLFTCYW